MIRSQVYHADTAARAGCPLSHPGHGRRGPVSRGHVAQIGQIGLVGRIQPAAPAIARAPQLVVGSIVMCCLLIVAGSLHAEQQNLEQTFIVGPARVIGADCHHPKAKGVAVVWRRNDSPLGLAGVPAGALILRYGTRRVVEPRDLVDAIQQYRGRVVQVEVLLPLQRGEASRRGRTFSVAAVPKRPNDEFTPHAFVFCVAGTNRVAGDHDTTTDAAALVHDSITDDPVAESCNVGTLDDWPAGADPRQVLRIRLASFCEKATENDAVLVFFFGHGGFDPKVFPAEGHFLELDSSGPRQTHVGRNEILAMLPKHVRLRGLITDSCFSRATFIDRRKYAMEQRTEQMTQSLPTTWQKLLLQSTGVVSLNGCSRNQKAFSDPYPPGNMIFTEQLTAASLRENNDWLQFVQTVADLTSRRFREVRPRIPALMLEGQLDQLPQVFPNEHRVQTRDVGSKGVITRAKNHSVWKAMGEEAME